MGNNVGGSGKSPINIKLFNGKNINLNKLDKLVEKSVDGSIFAWADGQNGGVKDKHFDKAEIDFIKQKFIQAYASDNEVSQEELNMIFGSGQTDEYGNKKDFDVNNLMRTMNSIKDDDETSDAQSGQAAKETPPPQQKDQVTTTYTIQPGDTPEKLAKRFGLSQEALAALRAQTDKNGWFRVHQKVTIQGDHAAAIKKMADSGEYSEDYKVLMERWANTESGKKQIAAAKAKKEAEQNKTPDAVTKYLETIKGDKGTAEITKNSDGTYSVVAKGTNFQKTNKLTQTITKFDKNGNKLSQVQYLQNGNVKTLTYGPDGKITSTKIDDADKTPQSQRVTIASTKSIAKTNAASIKSELQAFWTSNSDARNLLKTGMTNRQAAYVIEQYPDLVKDIDDVAGMDKDDILTYVVKPLNARLRELGCNKYCMSTDLSKLSVDDIKKKCSNVAALIRKIDVENGYVYRPESGKEGKLQEPRRPSQSSNYVAPGRKTVAKPTSPKPNATQKSGAATKSAAQKPEAPKGLTEQQKTQRNRMLNPNEWSLPQKMQDLIIDLRIRGIECTVSQKRDGSYEVGYKKSNKGSGVSEFTIPTVTDKAVLDKIAPGILTLGSNDFSNPDGSFDFLPDNMKEKTLVFDKNGNLVQQVKKDQYKTTVTSYSGNKVGNTEVKYKDRVTYGNIDAQRQVSSADKVPVKIKISRPDDLNEDGQAYANSLEANKAEIMKTLGLTNAEYDMFARMAMGIAEQETHFGNLYSSNSTKKDDGVSSTLRSLPWVGDSAANAYNNIQFMNTAKQTMDALYYSDAPEWVKDSAFGVAGAVSDKIDKYHDKYTDGSKSYGMTQVKIDEFLAKDENGKYKNPVLANQLIHFGIKSGDDIRTDAKKQAIATVIVLNNKRNALNATVMEVVNGKTQPRQFKKPDGTTGALTFRELFEINNSLLPENQRLSEADQIAILYNGFGKKKQDKAIQGKFGISDTPYARNVRAWTQGANALYSSSENAGSRARANNLGTEAQSNNGAIGTVIFMPTAYTTNVKSTKSDITNLENALNSNKSIPQALKDRLLDAVRKNEIAFGGKYGLTEDEAKSITAKDVKLMLDKLDALKNKIEAQGATSAADIRALARQTDDDFRSSYLQSRQLIFNDSDLKKSEILPALGTGDVVNQRLKPRGGYKLVVNEGNVHNFRAGARRSHVTRDNGQYYGFGVEADKGVNPFDANGNYLPQQQRMIAEIASDVAAIMDCGNNCTTGVKVTFESAGVVKSRSDIGFAEADGSWNRCEKARDLARYFQKHPEKFEEVKYLSLGNGTSREINASDIRNLPAGYIVVFIPGPGFDNQAGHAFITNGNGQGYADEVDNIRWDNFVSNGAGNGKGEHGTFKIFKLSEKFKLNQGGG